MENENVYETDLDYADIYMLEPGNPEDDLTPENVRNGYKAPLTLKNETPSAFVVNSEALMTAASALSLAGTHLISQMKGGMVNTSMVSLPERSFMNEIQREQWIQEFTGPSQILQIAQSKLPLDLKLDGVLLLCINKKVDLKKAVWLIKVVGRYEMSSGRQSEITLQQHAKASFDFAKVFRSSMLRQLDEMAKAQNLPESTEILQEKISRWRYMLSLSSILYRDGLLMNSEFLNDILIIFAKCSIRQVPILLSLVRIFVKQISKSRFLLRRLVIHCIQRIHFVSATYKLEDNKESNALFKSLLNNILDILTSIFNESTDVFVSQDIWEPFFFIFTRHRQRLKLPFSHSRLKSVDFRNGLSSPRTCIKGIEDIVFFAYREENLQEQLNLIKIHMLPGNQEAFDHILRLIEKFDKSCIYLAARIICELFAGNHSLLNEIARRVISCTILDKKRMGRNQLFLFSYLHTLGTINIFNMFSSLVGKNLLQQSVEESTIFLEFPIQEREKSIRNSIFFGLMFDHKLKLQEEKALTEIQLKFFQLLQIPFEACDDYHSSPTHSFNDIEAQSAHEFVVTLLNLPHYLQYLFTEWLKDTLCFGDRPVKSYSHLTRNQFANEGLFPFLVFIFESVGDMHHLLELILLFFSRCDDRRVIFVILSCFKRNSAVFMAMGCSRIIFECTWNYYQQLKPIYVDRYTLSFLSRFLLNESCKLSFEEKFSVETELKHLTKPPILADLHCPENDILQSLASTPTAMASAVNSLCYEGRGRESALALLDTMINVLEGYMSKGPVFDSSHGATDRFAFLLWEATSRSSHIDHTIIRFLTQKSDKLFALLSVESNRAWIWNFILRLICRECCPARAILSEFLDSMLIEVVEHPVKLKDPKWSSFCVNAVKFVTLLSCRDSPAMLGYFNVFSLRLSLSMLRKQVLYTTEGSNILHGLLAKFYTISKSEFSGPKFFDAFQVLVRDLHLDHDMLQSLCSRKDNPGRKGVNYSHDLDMILHFGFRNSIAEEGLNNLVQVCSESCKVLRIYRLKLLLKVSHDGRQSLKTLTSEDIIMHLLRTNDLAEILPQNESILMGLFLDFLESQLDGLSQESLDSAAPIIFSVENFDALSMSCCQALSRSNGSATISDKYYALAKNLISSIVKLCRTFNSTEKSERFKLAFIFRVRLLRSLSVQFVQDGFRLDTYEVVQSLFDLMASNSVDPCLFRELLDLSANLLDSLSDDNQKLFGPWVSDRFANFKTESQNKKRLLTLLPFQTSNMLLCNALVPHDPEAKDCRPGSIINEFSRPWEWIECGPTKNTLDKYGESCIQLSSFGAQVCRGPDLPFVEIIDCAPDESFNENREQLEIKLEPLNLADYSIVQTKRRK